MQVVKHQDITVLLRDISSGRANAFDDLLPLVYDQLKRLARHRLSREYGPSTLATTGLVHEAYLKLARNSDRVDWKDRNHFYAIASRAMRQVLVGRAIARKATKRGGSAEHVSVDEVIPMSEGRAAELIALDEGLNLLATSNPRVAQVVDLRYFGGFSISEAAEIMDISEATVNRDWRVARVWLFDFMKGQSA